MNNEQICFTIISLAGESFAMMSQALQYAKRKEFDKADASMEEAKQILHKAHVVHTELLSAEANGITPEFSVILVHAQDNLMNTILAETMFTEMIDLYKNK